jgi:hypothetical protein
MWALPRSNPPPRWLPAKTQCGPREGASENSGNSPRVGASENSENSRDDGFRKLNRRSLFYGYGKLGWSVRASGPIDFRRYFNGEAAPFLRLPETPLHQIGPV